MLYAAIAPAVAMRSFFGETIDDGPMSVVVANWGVLIALMGALLFTERCGHRRANSRWSLPELARSRSSLSCLREDSVT